MLKHLSAAGVVSVVSMAVATPALAQDGDPLVAGVEAAFPPWAYVEDGAYKGIAIDAMRAIAEDQGLTVEFKDLPWPSLIPALAKGRIDLLVTGLNVTEARAKVLDFSIPWWENDDEVLVAADSDHNVVTALCCGATVGAQGGATQYEWLQANLVDRDVDVTLRAYEDYITAVEDLGTGRLDAVVTSTDTAEELIDKGRPIRIVGTIQQNQPQALAVQEGDPKGLLAQLNAGIVNISESGQWAEIVKTYSPQASIRPIPTTMPDYVDSYQTPIPGYTP
ncbi:ABC transporter substrate-binding protein [Roseospira goensis]|uniref:Polar amino acid transport system substrate-binding protein n=1 Tax=Roseospira goensis TaxID=391922 RepID=A0A7W6WKK8_9PROT|nr:ABC transporter substrate-binding protein [Roseospira goensis]MBB4285718.1 polar amino acid transport system substrate-binding protein [Roseospira goensis]